MTDKNKAGLVGGLILGGWHVLWSALVLTGVGQVIYDFVLWAHMIHIPVIIGPFDATAAAVLVVMTAIVGYLIGCSSAWVWDKVHRG